MEKGTLSQINIEDFNVEREYNFVFLKHNLHNKEYLNWYTYFKTILLKIKIFYMKILVSLRLIPLLSETSKVATWNFSFKGSFTL